MASSGSFTESVWGGASLVVEWELMSQNVVNRTSSVKVTAYLKTGASKFTEYKKEIARINVNNNVVGSVDITRTGAYSYGANGKYQLCTTRPYAVVYESSGGKSQMDIEVTFETYANKSDQITSSVTASRIVTLDPIASAATISLSKSSITIGNSLVVNMNRNTSKSNGQPVTCTLRYAFVDNKSVTFATKTSSSSVTLDTSSKVVTLCEQIPSNTSEYLYIYCDTYARSVLAGDEITEDVVSEVLVGTTSKRITISVPADVVPTIGTVTISEANGELNGKLSEYAKLLSKFSVAMNASGKYGSSIVEYKVTADGTSYSSGSGGAKATIVTNTILSYGTIPVTVTVVDSRGRTASTQKNVTVIDYSPPTISNVKVVRCDKNGTSNDAGTYVKVTANVKTYLYDKVSTVNKVYYVATIYAKKQKDSYYTTIYTKSSFNSTKISEIIGSENSENTKYIDPDFAYDVIITVTDTFNNRGSFNSSVTSSYYTMELGSDGKSISFGQACENDGCVSFGMPAKFVKGFDYSPHQWITVDSFNSPFAQAAADGLRYRKIGNRITIQGRFATTSEFLSSGSYQKAFSLGYGPKIALTTLGNAFGGTLTLVHVYITSSGNVNIGRVLKLEKHGGEFSLVPRDGAFEISLNFSFYTD